MAVAFKIGAAGTPSPLKATERSSVAVRRKGAAWGAIRTS